MAGSILSNKCVLVSLPGGGIYPLSFEFEIFTFTEFNDMKTLAEYDFAPVGSLILNTGNTEVPDACSSFAITNRSIAGLGTSLGSISDKANESFGNISNKQYARVEEVVSDDELELCKVGRASCFRSIRLVNSASHF